MKKKKQLLAIFLLKVIITYFRTVCLVSLVNYILLTNLFICSFIYLHNQTFLDISSLDELKSCYGLPYGLIGTFSIIPMLFATIEIILPPINIRRLYNTDSREYFIFVIMSGIIGIMKVGPVIYTCIRCHGEWDIVLIALGQLTPRGYVILSINDEKGNDDIRTIEWQRINWEDSVKGKIRKIDRNKLFIVLLLTISGWLGTISFAIIHKMNTTAIISTTVPMAIFVLLSLIIIHNSSTKQLEFIVKAMIVFVIIVIVNFHIIGPVIYLGLATTNYGIANTGAGVTSCIIFIFGDLIQLFIYYLELSHEKFGGRFYNI